jgi:bacillithiol system protein YtxJ
MTLFKSIFGAPNADVSKSKLNWIALTDINQLEEIRETSFKKPVIIFKHSTRCGTSSMALKQFEREFNLENEISTYFLDILEYRAISTEIINRFGIVHQSPQLLLIKDGKCIYNSSHYEIDASLLASKI